uniref:Protein kinase domain-containing protein n=1 Tax=Eutreptiella gymnastica TaxID=73025 RepID=A0A7S1NFI9_9EUGL
MSQEDSYLLGEALSKMEQRLNSLLVPKPSAGQQAQYSITSKLKDVVVAVKQDAQKDQQLKKMPELVSLAKELCECMGIISEGKASPAPQLSTVGLASDMKTSSSSSMLSPKVSKPVMVLSARHCVVCKRDDRPGEQRKSGFKCYGCIGTASNIEKGNISFVVMQTEGTKNKDEEGNKSIEEYDLGDKLGQGAYGKVKTCVHKKSGQVYAMKIIDKAKLLRMRKPGSDKTEFDKVLKEIEIMKALHHPNVVKMYEVIEDPSCGKMYLIMEHCAGGEINDDEGYARTHPERLQKYIVAIANGLMYLHEQNIFHRDLKPANILLDSYDHVKLADFGVSTFNDDGILTDNEGTPAFNAPEEYGDKLLVQGDKADIWSFGVTIYSTAFGYLPFMGADLKELSYAIQNNPVTYPDDTCPHLRDLLDRMMDKDPATRATLKFVLAHRYVADVRTVKGQAQETICCKIKSVPASEVQCWENTLDVGKYDDYDAIFVPLPTRGGAQNKKAVSTMNEYINSKGGLYQVVLPTPETCTLYRPRSSRPSTGQARRRSIDPTELLADSQRADSSATLGKPREAYFSQSSLLGVDPVLDSYSMGCMMDLADVTRFESTIDDQDVPSGCGQNPPTQSEEDPLLSSLGLNLL